MSKIEVNLLKNDDDKKTIKKVECKPYAEPVHLEAKTNKKIFKEEPEEPFVIRCMAMNIGHGKTYRDASVLEELRINVIKEIRRTVVSQDPHLEIEALFLQDAAKRAFLDSFPHFICSPLQHSPQQLESNNFDRTAGSGQWVINSILVWPNKNVDSSFQGTEHCVQPGAVGDAGKIKLEALGDNEETIQDYRMIFKKLSFNQNSDDKILVGSFFGPKKMGKESINCEQRRILFVNFLRRVIKTARLKAGGNFINAIDANLTDGRTRSSKEEFLIQKSLDDVRRKDSIEISSLKKGSAAVLWFCQQKVKQKNWFKVIQVEAAADISITEMLKQLKIKDIKTRIPSNHKQVFDHDPIVFDIQFSSI